MIGKYHVNIETAGLKYSFDIRRNITVIQGDSATGKTTLIEILADYKPVLTKEEFIEKLDGYFEKTEE